MADSGDAMRGAAGVVGGSLTPEAFAARLDEHRRLLWAIAAGVSGERDAAEDIVQEAATIGLAKLDEFDPATSFGAWMGKVVRFCALNHARLGKRRRTKPSADPAAGVAGPEDLRATPVTPRGEVSPGQDAFDDRVVGALSTLEPPARACLLLRTVVGLSYREIASAMDLPEGTAMSHVHRARRRMREALRDTDHDGGKGKEVGER